MGERRGERLRGRHWLRPPERPPPCPPKWREVRLRVASYNVLAQCYAKSKHFTKTKLEHLRWDVRRKALLEVIEELDADIIVLQEVDNYDRFWKDEMLRLGYKGVYKQRNSIKNDGCATFYRHALFSMVESQTLEFDTAAGGGETGPDFATHNVALLTTLRPEGWTGAGICVANAHLFWDPSYEELKVAQAKALVAAARDASLEHDARSPLILAGDFNSVPQSVVYEWITSSQGFSSAYCVCAQSLPPPATFFTPNSPSRLPVANPPPPFVAPTTPVAATPSPRRPPPPPFALSPPASGTGLGAAVSLNFGAAVAGTGVASAGGGWGVGGVTPVKASTGDAGVGLGSWGGGTPGKLGVDGKDGTPSGTPSKAGYTGMAPSGLVTPDKRGLGGGAPGLFSFEKPLDAASPVFTPGGGAAFKSPAVKSLAGGAELPGARGLLAPRNVFQAVRGVGEGKGLDGRVRCDGVAGRGETDFTNYRDVFHGTIDYIFIRAPGGTGLPVGKPGSVDAEPPAASRGESSAGGGEGGGEGDAGAAAVRWGAAPAPAPAPGGGEVEGGGEGATHPGREEEEADGAGEEARVWVSGSLSMVGSAEARCGGAGLPSARHPSDHLPIAADLILHLPPGQKAVLKHSPPAASDSVSEAPGEDAPSSPARGGSCSTG